MQELGGGMYTFLMIYIFHDELCVSQLEDKNKNRTDISPKDLLHFEYTPNMNTW